VRRADFAGDRALPADGSEARFLDRVANQDSCAETGFVGPAACEKLLAYTTKGDVTTRARANGYVTTHPGGGHASAASASNDATNAGTTVRVSLPDHGRPTTTRANGNGRDTTNSAATASAGR